MVHIDLQELHKGASPKVHPLCQPVHRSTRTATGRREDSRDSAQESTGNGLQGQESSTDHDVSSRMAGSNTQFVTFAKSKEQPLGDDPRGISPTESADQSDRGSTQPDRATAAVCHQPSQPDRPVGLPTESQAECLTLGSHQRVQLHDTLGKEHAQQPRNQTVLDTQYFHDLLMKEEIVPNEIFRETHVYWGKRFGTPDPQEQRRHLNHKGIDLLEVYCSSDSQLTMQANLGGLVASRFGLKHGDLGTFAGRCALYDQIWKLRPKHIWVSPKCGPWCSWSRLNLMKSVELAQRILTDRRAESIHLRLRSSLCCLQRWRGPDYPFHLEQPQGSELMLQTDMQPVVDSTQRVLCDMCVAGELRHPNSQELLRKRTQVWTTSTIMASRLERLQCPGSHQHASIAGSCKTPGQARQTVSSYTENYTRLFAQHLSRIIQCSLQVKETHEHSLSEACRTVYAAEIEDTNPAKRRRLNVKSPADALYEPLGQVDTRTALELLLHRFEDLAPRVGKRVLSEGPCFDSVQQIFPNMQIQAIELCKGVDRLRTMDFPAGKGTHRWTFGRERKLLQFFSDQQWENLSKLSHRQKIRNGTPARFSLTPRFPMKEFGKETKSQRAHAQGQGLRKVDQK